MLEYQRDPAIAEAIDRERSRRILRLVDAKIQELAEEAAYSLQGQEDEAQDFASLWDAVCYYVARDKPDDLKKYEKRMAETCLQALQGYSGDRFTVQVLAAITAECDDFYRNAARGDEPAPWSLDEWTTKAINSRLLELARDEARSGFFSYDPKLLNQVIACLRSLIPMADSGSSLTTIGRAIDAVESFEKGRRGHLNVDIGCAVRAGDADFQEEEFAFIEIRDASIGLSTLHTTYQEQVGSDHSLDNLPFPAEFEKWREVFERIRREEKAKLTVNFPYE
jgi:hypothetical protein